MTTGSILLSIALFLIVAIFVARPFLLPKQQPPRLTEHQILDAEKEALLAQIRALDFDAETDKQDDEVYQREREQLMQKATIVLQKLDQTQDIDQAIEAAIGRLIPQDEQTHCPKCQNNVTSTDRFCANCGHNLTTTNEGASS